jgi:hypothetical protein
VTILDFSQTSDAAALLIPAALHLALVVGLYSWLSVERLRNATGQGARYSDLVLPGGDSGRAARIAANLSNQFEAPALFHPLVLILWATSSATGADLVLAWMFVAGRVLHTLVQTLTTNVVLRGVVFSLNFLALSLMWIGFLIRALA